MKIKKLGIVDCESSRNFHSDDVSCFADTRRTEKGFFYCLPSWKNVNMQCSHRAQGLFGQIQSKLLTGSHGFGPFKRVS